MSSVGLVLGGGGITGAAFHFGALFALRMATGWDPDRAEVIIGTSGGAFAAAMVRGDGLHLETLVGDAHNRADVAEVMRQRVYQRGRPRGVVRWLRRGVLPSLRRPDINLILGSPALYRTEGLMEWLTDSIGEMADGWAERPTVIIAYDVEERRRVPFGTETAPDAPLKLAVAASSAVPFVFEPVMIDGRWYADGGLASGTSADLVLGHPTPLDLVLVIAPMAAAESRPGSRFYEDVFDRAGRAALSAELATIREAWPDSEIVVLRPDDDVLEATRPNPLSVEAAVPAFLSTLRSMRRQLSRPDVWDVLAAHLGTGARSA